MISQGKVEKCCRKARHIFARTGDIEKALIPLNRMIGNAGLPDAPLDLLMARLTLLMEADQHEDALNFAEGALAERPLAAERVRLLKALRHLPTVESNYRHLYRVWMQCAACELFDLALDTARSFPQLPPNSRKALRTSFQSLRKETPDSPLADLGLVHLALSLKKEQAAYPALARLSARPPPVGSHAAEVLTRMPMPTDVELLWMRAVAFLLTGNRPNADATISRIIATDPVALVGFLQRESSETLLDTEEKESAALLALKRAPRSIRTRSFLFDLYRDELRLDEALVQLRAMAETDATEGALESFLDRANDLIARFPEQSAPRLLHAWILGRMDRREAFAGALRELLPESPEKVHELLREWSLAAGNAARAADFVLLKAESLAALGKHAEATVELRRLLRSADDPAALLKPLTTMSARYPGHTPYLLVLGRARHRAGDGVGAIRSFESLLERSTDHADRVQNLLGSWTFEGEARPLAGVLTVRSLLIQERMDDAAAALERLAELSREHLDAGIEHALHWRERFLDQPARAVRFASLLFRTGRTEVAIDFLADALAKAPHSSSELATVFDQEHLVGRRDLPILVLRCRLLIEAQRFQDATAVAMNMGDAGHPKQEYRWLRTIRPEEGMDDLVLRRLLATAIEIDRPTAELLTLGRDTLEKRIPADIREAQSLLAERHRISTLGPEGSILLGNISVELGLIEEAAALFVEVLPVDPVAAQAGIDAVLEKDPDRHEARFALVQYLTEGREFEPALMYLRMATEHTDDAWAALDALTRVTPAQLDAWDLKSIWLTDLHRWPELIAHLGRWAEVDRADLGAIDHALVEIGKTAKPCPAALWLRAHLARKTGRIEDEIDLYHRLADLGADQFSEIFTRLDSLIRANPGAHHLILDDLRLAVRAGDLERVLAAGKETLARDELADRIGDAAALLGKLTEKSAFSGSREFLHLAFTASCRAAEPELAHRVFPLLVSFEQDQPMVQDEMCTRWRESFGDSVPIVELQARARIRANRATGSIPHIRRVVELGLDEKAEQPIESIRRGLGLAEAAAESAPKDPNVHLLASDLAAEADDPERALLHAVAPLSSGNHQPVLRQLERLSLAFPEDARFAHALAVRIHEPIDQREEVAACLATMLDREPETAPEVMVIAERLCSSRPTPAPFLSVRARAAVLLATGAAKTALRAVACLRELLETDPHSAAEVLAATDRVIANRAESLPAHVLREETLRALCRPRDAREQIENNIVPRARRKSDRFMAHYRLADVLEELGEFLPALENWRTCTVIDPGNEEIPLRIRRDFDRHRESQLPERDNGRELERGVIALWRGTPQEALGSLPPVTGDEALPPIGLLAVRGNALLILDRHAQLRDELFPHLGRIPVGGPLTAFEREYLYSLGASALRSGDEPVGLQCLERIARRYPAHRAVRTLLDRHYAARHQASTVPLQVTFHLEQAVRS